MDDNIYNEEDEQEIFKWLKGEGEGNEKDTPEYRLHKNIVQAGKEYGRVNLIREIHEKQLKKQKQKKLLIFFCSTLFVLCLAIIIYFTSQDPSSSIEVPIDGIIPKNSQITKTINQGESFEGYVASGTYVDTFVAVNGMDSIRTLVLTVLPRKTIKSQITKTINQGESFEKYTTSGTYIDTLLALDGSDSIRTLNLIVLHQNSIKTQVTKTIIQGDIFEGYTKSGIYTDIFKTSSGTDSIRILILKTKPIEKQDLDNIKPIAYVEMPYKNDKINANFRSEDETQIIEPSSISQFKLNQSIIFKIINKNPKDYLVIKLYNKASEDNPISLKIDAVNFKLPIKLDLDLYYWDLYVNEEYHSSGKIYIR